MGSTAAAEDPAAQNARPLSVLFVCLGNICRSPMAEAVFRHHAASSPLTFSVIDSAGTGAYHVHSPPDDRTVSTLKAHSIPCKHSARKVDDRDFTAFDYILAMDNDNLEDLQESRAGMMRRVGTKNLAGKKIAEVRLFGDYNIDGSVCKNAGDGEVVPDPYYGARGGFESVYQQLTRFTSGFLAYLAKQQGTKE